MPRPVSNCIRLDRGDACVLSLTCHLDQTEKDVEKLAFLHGEILTERCSRTISSGRKSVVPTSSENALRRLRKMSAKMRK